MLFTTLSASCSNCFLPNCCIRSRRKPLDCPDGCSMKTMIRSAAWLKPSHFCCGRRPAGRHESGLAVWIDECLLPPRQVFSEALPMLAAWEMLALDERLDYFKIDHRRFSHRRVAAAGQACAGGGGGQCGACPPGAESVSWYIFQIKKGLCAIFADEVRYLINSNYEGDRLVYCSSGVSGNSLVCCGEASVRAKCATSTTEISSSACANPSS